MDWVTSLFDETTFAEEQARLVGTWTFLGLTSDLAADDSWITGRVGGRSVFVQRFGDTLRGFENSCAHRQFPLRQGDAGRGAVICGFHHWRYDAEGRAVGVPIAANTYGCTAEALDAQLAPLEVATCGVLVFGRSRSETPSGDPQPSLEAFLGPGFTILAAVCDLSDSPSVRSFGRLVAANWKLMVAITLDDYHTPAVHGRTLSSA